MPSIFTKIINGDIPCHKIAETDDCICFLDIHPVARGHALVVPKKEVDYLFDLEAELYQKVMDLARRVARAQDKVIDCQRVGVAVVGTEVPHAHVHLIPFQHEGQVHLSAPKMKFSQEELAEIAREIREAL